MNADTRRLIQVLFLSAFICVHLRLIPSCFAETDPHFEKRWLSGQFFSEGANFGDFNHDGKPDVVSGPTIWDGPNFTIKHNYMPPVAFDPLGYSKNFFAFARDLNGDGWDDIFIIGFPGEQAFWYENPKGESNGPWKQHLAFEHVDNESPTLMPDSNTPPTLICMTGGQIGYAQPDKSDPNKPWAWHPISPKADYQRFTHGLGIGDVNGDGKFDILEKSGWWEQPESLDGDPMWKKHDVEFSKAGASQMYVYDVNNDGRNDVVCALAAHGYGLAWYENIAGADGQITFKQHIILSPNPSETTDGVQFSQLHAVDLVDMNGDGVKDILTGKRYWAHGPHGDPDPEGMPVLYYFKLTRGEGGTVKFEPHLIDDHSGVGTQIVGKDVNGDGKPDVIVGNKRGTILFLSK